MMISLPGEREDGSKCAGEKIFHFVICHLAHIRVMCDCF